MIAPQRNNYLSYDLNYNLLEVTSVTGILLFIESETP